MINRLILAATLAAIPAAAPAAWQQATSRHFVVYTDDTPDHARAYTAQLERYDAAMHALYDLPDAHATPAARVSVYIVPSLGDVEALIGNQDVAGFYIPRARGSVAFVPKYGRGGPNQLMAPQQVLLHEYAHHFMFANWGDTVFPAWFVEGFAEFNATAEFEKNGDVTVGSVPLYRQYGVQRGDRVPAATLLTSNGHNRNAVTEEAFYGRAWLLTHYLMSDPERRALLGRYVAALNSGTKPADAARLLGDPAALDRALDRYAFGRALHAFVIPAALIAPGEVSVRALRPAETATMPARIRTARGVNDANRADVAALAARLAAPYPDDPAAQGELAEADFDAGDHPAAEAAAFRAIAADPKDADALVTEGRARLADAVAAKATDPARWIAARQWLLRANRLDPDDPWPLLLFFRSFAQAREVPTPGAVTGLERAHELAPFDQGLSLTLANYDLRQGKLDDARRVLEPVAYNPHGGATAERAGHALEAIDKSDGPGARAALRGKEAGEP